MNEMNREAMLLYLRDLRDLEVARNRINEIIHKEYNITKRKWDDLNRTNLVDVPAKEKNSRLGTAFIAMCFISGCLMLFLIWPSFSRPGADDDIFLKIFTFGAILAIIAGFLSLGVRRWFISDNKKDIERAEVHNAIEVLRVSDNAEESRNLERRWKERLTYLENERNEVSALLEKSYSLNIIANQYRTLASIYYIYDYMSSSQATLEETLMHEHMENGIQRILSKLDGIIESNQQIIFQNRAIEASNRKMIAQNEQMLTSLQSTEYNTAIAAQYAGVAASYSAANAYFSAANYLVNSSKN